MSTGDPICPCCGRMDCHGCHPLGPGPWTRCSHYCYSQPGDYELQSRWDRWHCVLAICRRLGITVDALQALADQWGDGSEPACYRNDEVELTIKRIRKEDP